MTQGPYKIGDRFLSSDGYTVEIVFHYEPLDSSDSYRVKCKDTGDYWIFLPHQLKEMQQLEAVAS